MDTRVEKTIERHKKGYNCAQAVACTYCDLVGVDEETMFKMTEALGLGMGCMDGTCGAVAGACILAGMKRAREIWKSPTARQSPISFPGPSWEVLKRPTERRSARN